MLSACLIVKNESEILAKCLESLQGFDEIVVCDTGSEDNSVEIAKQSGAKVFTDYQWNDHYSEARNYAIRKCTGDWILSIDADEQLLTPVKEIKQIIAEKAYSLNSFDVIMMFNGKESHRLPRLFRNNPDKIFYKGRNQESLSIIEKNPSEIKINFGWSPAHLKDPDRNLRMLQKAVKEDPNCLRELYYLAREWFYKQEWEKALWWWTRYLKRAWWVPEWADTWLYIARCHWNLGDNELAKDACLQALKINANFKEAILFLSSLCDQTNKAPWLSMAETASNESVLFIRT
jgi:glycosyltransferase involved in cell wall biosynthesis